MSTVVHRDTGYSRSIVLSLVTATLTACALSVMNVHQTSPLLDDLAVSTKEEEDHRSKAKVTQWRDRRQFQGTFECPIHEQGD